MPTETTTTQPMTWTVTWTEPNAVQIHIALDGIAPPIWRRLVVPLDITLVQLHQIIQAAMGWTDSHMNEVLSAERSDDDVRA